MHVMKHVIQRLELMVMCEKKSTYVDDNMVILDMHPLMKGKKF
jgi:hypothetical protein